MIFTGGMAIAGVGAGVNELTALAVASELAPTRKRGTYVAALVFTILPFCPSVLWGHLIGANAGWRYCGVLCGVWAAVGLILIIFFYFPPPRVNSQGLSRMEVFKQIDFMGGLLSISGMILFMAGLQWGGYQVSCLLKWNGEGDGGAKTKSSTPGKPPTSSSHCSWASSYSWPLLFGKRSSPNSPCFQHA